MDEPRATRLVETALRCDPARWRRRHGEEAAELAALLIRDGTPAGSIAWSYLVGAAREWLTPHPGRRLSTVACALLVAACCWASRRGCWPRRRRRGRAGVAYHGPGARVRALPAWSACARSGRDPRRGPPAGDHLGSRAWPILLTPVLLTPVLPGPAARRRRRRALAETAIMILVAVLLAGLVRAFVFPTFWIPSSSMAPTLACTTESWCRRRSSPGVTYARAPSCWSATRPRPLPRTSR